MKNLTDNQLLALAKNKDERAIEELLERYKYVAASVSRSYFLVGGANDDLLQEGMIGVFRAINTFDSEKAEFKTYVYTCVKSSIISYVLTVSVVTGGYIKLIFVSAFTNSRRNLA
jgi:RNA polymerase sporulation-specific sigma factor